MDDAQVLNLSAALPYEPSISSSASSSSSSVFSVNEPFSSHASDTSSDAGSVADQKYPYSTVQRSRCRRAAPSVNADLQGLLQLQQLQHLQQASVAKPHPRRGSVVANQRPPPLQRQSERKGNFVDNLVDSATQIVEVIWPLSVPSCREGSHGRGVLPLRTFIQETLRRSRTSYSTLQVALYYLILVKSKIPKCDFTMEQPADQSLRALQCGRRMFLAALILASKYLQDRNYSARAWSKISGLKVCEINTNEMAFLEAVNWKLHIVDPIFERWREIVLFCTPSQQPPSSPGPFSGIVPGDWKSVIPLLNPELDTVPIPSRTSTVLCPPALKFSQASPTPAADTSGETTPTPSKLPRFLEPRTETLPPTPSVPRMGPLPTPQMTPSSTASSTPAVGASAYGSRRPSMCSVMAQMQHAGFARCATEVWNPSSKPIPGADAFQFGCRRPSIAPSLSSSPESMVSDHTTTASSRSSRSSSISSVSSCAWAPNNAKLARLATCRNVKPFLGQLSCPKENTVAEQAGACGPATSEPISSPDFENFRLTDSEPSLALPLPVRNGSGAAHVAADADASPSRPRKRGRSSADLNLQRNVRELLHHSRSTSRPPPSVGIVPDRTGPDSFLLSGLGGQTSDVLSSKALQSPSTFEHGRLPVSKELGRKRACCASEVALAMRPSGPGMWEGIL